MIVGFGRVGGALARGLVKAKWDVALLPRSQDSVRRAALSGFRLADHDDLRAAQLCILSVPDAQVQNAAELVLEDLGPSAALVHCSGAHTLAAFGQAAIDSRRLLGSLHPLAAISDPTDPLEGHTAALAATSPVLLATLELVAKALGMNTMEVPETGRAAYHAGAVLSAGLLVSLADGAVAALEHAGLEREQALEALLPLMSSALRGLSTRGFARGLTGPVVRGDVGVVQAHLDALPPELGSVYRLLSRRTLALVGERLPEETKHALKRILA
ncbi:MAG: DUF2520 domain-containing protein [Myxococcaceae bacterium]|nr:DUF2520 domain-containing protein [Myxococcaceae bacterium]